MQDGTEYEIDGGRQRKTTFLRWLAECQRSNSIAQPRSFPIDTAWLQIETLRSQAEYWQSEGFDLFYEPRSLTVSPRGGQVAVGTKAGEVCLAIWDAKEQTWKDRRVSKESIRNGRNLERNSSPSAVRGLIILDEHTLVAAWGLSSFSIVTFVPGLAEPDVIALEPGEKDPTVTGTRIGFQRFNRLVHLYPPQESVPDNGDVVLGIPRGGNLLHVLRRERGEYVRCRATPQDLFPKWDEQGGRLVDGVWQHGVLWLLTSRGWLVRYSAGEFSTDGLIPLGADIIAPPRQHARFRRLGACEAGLAILTAESVAFQWLAWKPENARPDLEAGPIQWFHVPGAQDCAACVPYPGQATAREICNSKFNWRNPVWSVVSSAEPGLRWIAWTNPRFSDPSRSAREIRPAAHAAPANFAVSGGGSILHVGFGRSSDAPGAPPFLACGTRDHKLLIASVLDRWACEDELDQQMAQSIDSASSETDERKGIQWWHLQRRIHFDFETIVEPLSDEERKLDYPNSLLDCTDPNNLRFIASKLVEWYDQAIEREHVSNTSFEGDRDQFAQRAEKSLSVLTLWILRLLLRSKQLGANVDREIALLLVEKLQLVSLKAGHSEDRLLSLAGFLRKWIVHGGTYSEKISGVYKVYEWNRECGRNMDALVYLTRLIRQKVDQNWEATPPVGPWAPTVWSLVTGVAGEFTIVSLADGGLCAISGDGELIRWQIDEAELGGNNLRLRSNNLRMESSKAEQFEERYRHGPYARSLWLTQVGGSPPSENGDREYLLVFCLKGWRREDREQTGGLEPRIYALRIRSQSEGSEGARQVRALSVEAIKSEVVCNELYSLCAVESEDNRFVLAAGTSLSWKASGDHEPWRPQPFIQITIQLTSESIQPLQIDPVRIERFEESERSVLRRESVPPETAYNPSWSIVRSLYPSKDGTNEIWLWAGFQDGNIRGYRRELDSEGKHFWQERQRTEEGRPVRRGLKTTGAVWRLLEFKGRGGEPMLAYGTGDGVVGAVLLSDLLKTEAGDPVSFFVHTREGAPICGLLHYADRENGNSRPFLLSVTQAGMVSIFNLDYSQWPASGHAEESRRRGYRLHPPGFRVDRFRLPRTLRAIAWIDPKKADRGTPRFVFGSVEGKVYECSLYFPHYSERRRGMTFVLEMLSQTTKIGRPVREVVPQIGDQVEHLLTDRERGATLHLWLRVLTTGESMLRYSLWDELRRAGDKIWSEPDGASEKDIEESFSRLLETIKRLATETYRRIPFSKDPAKLLWLEGGKIASHIALQALKVPGASVTPESRTARKLRHYHDLNILFSDLCNRWIGAAQSIELTMLIHSFTALFDWTAVILIATEQQPEVEAEKIRVFLIYNLIQRRLNFPEPIVPLETLRTINAAILRAILNNRKEIIIHRPFQILTKRVEDQQEGSPHGFYDLMTMVGDLWERQSPALSLSDPLVSEIIRFFSLSLLLLPDCALLTGQVVSESQLTEGGTKLAELILEQANRIRKELLAIKKPERRKDLLDGGLRLFRAYFGEGVNFAIAETEGPIPPPPPSLKETDTEWPWHYLLSVANPVSDQEPTDELSDKNMMIELRQVLRATAWISDLDRPGHFDITKLRTGEESFTKFTEPLRWLIGNGPCRFFKHSRVYLTRLLDIRQEVRSTAGLQPGPSKNTKSIGNALATCRDELDRLDGEYLFRPQRDHYREVINRWRDQLVNRAGEAVQVVEILDQFNRHVYRTSADNLMDNIVDLSMQIAPISPIEWLSHDHNGSLRRLIHERLQGFPLVQQVFEDGERLVDSTYLAGALLAVARNFLGKPGELGLLPSTPNVTPGDIEQSIQEAARRKGLPTAKGAWSPKSQRNAPGSRAIWDLIAQEFATNIAKYSRSDPSGKEKPSRIMLRYGVQKDEVDDICFLISANVAYRWSLDEKEQRRLETMGVAAAVKSMEGRFEQFLGVRERGHTDERGAGMGLYMIDKISRLIDMKASLLLFDPRDILAERSDGYTPVKKWEAPLCLCISLQTGSRRE